MASKRRLSDEEREQRRAQDRERLKQAAEQLLNSVGWQRWGGRALPCGPSAAVTVEPAAGGAGAAGSDLRGRLQGLAEPLSMRDVESLCVKAGLGKLSKATASRICQELRERFEAFKRRDLYEV